MDKDTAGKLLAIMSEHDDYEVVWRDEPLPSLLPDDATMALYVLLLRHGKATMAETMLYLASGESVTQIARRRSCLGGDARAVENVVYGYLRHDAPHLVRRTKRLARSLQRVEGLDLRIARNVEAVLAAIAARGTAPAGDDDVLLSDCVVNLDALLESEVPQDLRDLVGVF